MARPRYFFISFISAFILCSSCSLAIAAAPAYDPAKFQAIFGEPEKFIKDFEENLSPKLNEYLGLAISCTGFVWVARGLLGGS